MKGTYIVERMQPEEMHLALAWAADEGWNPGIHDADCFYQTDPQGFFVGKLDGKIIAVGSAVIYDEHFAFCGFYIVDKPYRGQGYGLKLTRERLNYVGKRNTGIDGVTHLVDKYARLGYKFAHNNARYECLRYIAAQDSAHIIPLAEINFNQLLQYDRRHFPAVRDAFLRCWINQPGGKALGYLQDDKLSGYGVIRPCLKGFKIGPLFADTPGIADKLFIHLAHHAKGDPVYLDIPENNPHALHLVKRHGLEKVFATARMYLKSTPSLETQHIFGITSFELG